MKPGLRKLLNFLFIAATLALVLVIAFANSDLENAWEALFTLNPYWLLASAGCWLAYLLFDALGYHYFLRKQNYGIRFRSTLFISLMGFYYGNITPGASGGQPMQIYYMNKHGVPIGIGTSGISMKFICNQLMVVLLASALWLWNMDFVNLQLSGARWLVVVGWLINFAAIPLILLVAFHRPLVQRVAGFLVRMGHKLRLVKDPEVTMLHIHTTLDSYHASFLRLTRHPRQVCIQLCLSALSVLGLMSVILCVYRAFGESGTPWQYLLTISFLLFLSASYTPLPGASGAQEGGFLIFYRGLFTTGTIGLALLVWRFMTYYLFLIVGAAATVLSHLRPAKKNAARPAG
ncbi:MAG: flippase-like domain-containing protein [Clostridiales bacterium]|nr:flippase-like domain-containing protein [Clostridiales bacterium]MDO4349607.1 lysylphosphatidylglycerol synthase transmembrane domain-containing protein [Eubacteriales bacterium]MDY4009291.1 lysylphosphatidylglycerol synthase transmembrane domain-containing protein [Candidatus Limiplasma sp.]